MKVFIAIATMMICALVLVAPAVAQEEIEIRTGKVIKRVGQTLVVNITDGSVTGNQIFKFTSKSNVKIYNSDGEEIQVFDIKEGDNLVGVRITTNEAPTSASATEVAAMTSSSSEELPHTAGQNGILLLAGLAFLALATGLTLRRQSV